MKKLTLADVTPGMMEIMSGMKSTEEIIAFCESKGFEISEVGAAKILNQFKKVDELTFDDLSAVSGGNYIIDAPSS